MRFLPYIGDLMGLPVNENYLVYRWLEPGCKVLFSLTRLGEAASVHLASDKNGLRKLKQAINEFCEYVFEMFGWCEMIIGKIERPSIVRLVTTCGFKNILQKDNKYIYARLRKWDS